VEWKGFKLDVDDVLRKLGFRQRSELERGVDELGRGLLEVNNAADAWRIVKDLVTLKPVEAIGERIELIPRVAAMRLAERRGATPVEAINAGRTTTIDFNKGGSWTRTINQIIPFFNVGIQSTADVQRAIAANPRAYTGTVAAAVVAPMALAEMWNQADPQRRKDYADVPSYIKDQGLVLMLPTEAPTDEQGNRHPQFIHFRYRELAPVAMLTREVLQRWFYDKAGDDDRRNALELGLSGLGQMSPVSASDPADLASSFLPPVLSTVLQASPSVDRDFFRRARIRSQYADERASPLSHWISDASGMRPSVAEFASRDIGTGYAGMLHGASELLAGDPNKPKSQQDIPIVGGLYGRVVKGSIGEGANRAREETVTPSAEKILKDAQISWRPQAADPEIGHIPLTRSEYAEYQKRLNRVTDETIQRLARRADWSKMSPSDKQSMIEYNLNTQRDAVRTQIITMIPTNEIKSRLANERAKGRLPATAGSRR
jgi:hypothetical protein